VSLYTPPSLRAAIEAALLVQLGGADPPWRVSRMSARLFPGQDTSQIERLAFAVGLGATEPLSRQARGRIRARTEVMVKFTANIRADNHVADEDQALVYELLILDALTDTAPVPVTVERIERDVIGDGTIFYGVLRCSALHAYET
jgi:hypothetical protein